MSDALHLVERWTRPDGSHLHVESRIEDPKFYTKPFTYSRTWDIGAPDAQVLEFSCSENNVDREHLGFGPGTVLPDGTIGYEDPAPLPAASWKSAVTVRMIKNTETQRHRGTKSHNQRFQVLRPSCASVSSCICNTIC